MEVTVAIIIEWIQNYYLHECSLYQQPNYKLIKPGETLYLCDIEKRSSGAGLHINLGEKQPCLTSQPYRHWASIAYQCPQHQDLLLFPMDLWTADLTDKHHQISLIQSSDSQVNSKAKYFPEPAAIRHLSLHKTVLKETRKVCYILSNSGLCCK